MSKITFEDYKKAIKAKYEEEIEGVYSNNLSSPTAANLRNLCIKRFTSNNSKDDLFTFESFFDFPFDGDKKNLFGDDELNKLEAVKRFFLGKTEKPAEDTIQLAAILVDLKPRPFKEFRKQIDEEDVDLIKDLRNTGFSKKNISSDNVNEETQIESFFDSEITSDEEEDSKRNEEEKEKEKGGAEEIKIENPKHPILRYFAITGILAGLCLIIYLALPQKECMQWSNDHYELVDCDVKIEGIGMVNQIELLDKSLFNLKKVNVCDTTKCFDKNGDAVIWYAKTENGIDFFNGHGRHPENNKALRPITQYIINKYVKK